MTQPASERTRIRRLAERGHYDRELIDAILDEALVCHVGFIADGTPMVIPTLHARDGDTLYLHGSPASRMLRSMRSSGEVCITVTLVDGIVLARAPFHSSMNYRSVVILGTPRIVDSGDEKMHAFRVLTEHVTPGRWDDCRRPNEKEQRSTLVVAVAISEASAKVRTGPPGDDEEDYDLPLWAGVIPLRLTPGEPVDDPRLRNGVGLPEYLDGFGR